MIEAHRGAARAATGQANTLSEIRLGDGAHARSRQVHAGRRRRRHLANWLATLGDGRRPIALFQLTAGDGAVAQQRSSPPSPARARKLDISGAFLARGSEHIDTTLVVDHAVPGCESRELFKGVLADHARGVFQGKVIVRPTRRRPTASRWRRC